MKKYLFFTAIFLTIYFIVAVYNSADFDLWHRLAAGKLFFAYGHVAETDIFAYTQTKDLWIDHEWGSGVIFYFILERFGEAGLGYLKALLIFLTFLPVYLTVRLRNGGKENYRIIFYLLFLYAILFGFVYTIRSQSFTFAFFALWIYLIELVKRGNRNLLWAFPPMTVVWANLHGGFFSGLGLLLMSGYPLTAFFSGLATIINPYGVNYWEYLAGAITMHRPYITEWRPLDIFGEPIEALGFKLFLLITIVALVYLFREKRDKIRWTEVLVLAVTCYLSLKHVRHNVFFIIASAAYMSEYFFAAVKHYAPLVCGILARLRKVGGVFVYGTILVLGFLTLHFVSLKLDVNESIYPVKSVEFIKKNNLSGNLLVLFNWGAYALWNLYPECRVAIDGRYEEVYPDSVVEASARFQYLEKDWEDTMKNHKTDLMLIDTSYPVFSELLTHDDWKMVYKDKVSAVFLPKSDVRKNYVMPDNRVVQVKKDLKLKANKQADTN